MQGDFLQDEELINTLKSTLTMPRLSRYFEAAEGNLRQALKLYHFNSKLSEAIYIPLQMWEVALRNRLNNFLSWKYNQSWPYDDRLIRNLANNDKMRLSEAKARQSYRRKLEKVPTDPIVAELSAGFWVSLLTKSYEIPFSWRYNLPRVFPYDVKLAREDASSMCDAILEVRNRVAHHEPIFHKDLDRLRNDLDHCLGAMCNAGVAYVRQHCVFDVQAP